MTADQTPNWTSASSWRHRFDGYRSPRPVNIDIASDGTIAGTSITCAGEDIEGVESFTITGRADEPFVLVTLNVLATFDVAAREDSSVPPRAVSAGGYGLCDGVVSVTACGEVGL